MTGKPDSAPGSDTSGSHEDPDVAAGLAFATERLGPASAGLLADPRVQTLLLSRLRAGADLEDAVLAEVHRAAVADRRVADEFVAYFLTDLMRLGKSALGGRLRSFLDTGDLVHSVVGDLWPALSQVRFETRGRFLSYLSKRMRWKAVDSERRERSQQRRREGRAQGRGEEPPGEEAPPSPLTQLVSDEERDRLTLILLRMADRDRELLTLYLRGESIDAIARELDLSRDAAYKALYRAIGRARGMA